MVFNDVRQKIPPPQAQTPSKPLKGSLFQNQNKPMNQSQNIPLQNTPSQSKVKFTSAPKLNASQKVPKTPSPIRTSRTTPILKASPAVPQQEHDPETDVKVFLRVRPILDQEAQADFSIDQNVVIAHTATKEGTSQNYAERKYTFTKVFDEKSYQDDIFVDVAMPLLKHFVRGHDGLIFAYGATSAGKTFTVRGSQEDPGLIPRITKSILGMEQPNGFERGLFVSCVEIYNERIQDLLGNNKNPLRISKDGFGYTVVKNATEIELKSFDDLKKILDTIDKNKSVGTTSYNSNSSRSHCVFTLKLITIPLDPHTHQRIADLSKITASRLSIVDLAGSERVKSGEGYSKIVNEARAINKSMLTLGKCIRGIRLAKNGQRNVQIPFRESKITELFKDFFDPVSQKKTYISIIINISPSTKQFDDTLFALQFAAEAIHCDIKSKNDDEDSDEDSEDDAVRALSFNEEEADQTQEQEPDEEVVNLIEAEAKIRQQVYTEMMSKMKEYQENQAQQLSQTKAHSAQSYPNKLQTALVIKAAGDQQRLQLEEFNREIERLTVNIAEKDAHLASLNDKLRQMELTLRAVMQDTDEKTKRKVSLEERAQRILATAQKLKNDISELMELHGRKMVQLKAQHEKEISQKLAQARH